MPKTDAAEHDGTISTRQMRQLHALLRDHGISGDKAVHAYINTALAELGDEPVESRSDLHATQAAHLIADLEAAEVAQPSVSAALTELRKPFSDEEIGQLPRSTCRACSDSRNKRCDDHQWVTRCGVCNGSHSSATMHITYVGHADVTARLLAVDPTWTWEPAEIGPSGSPSVAASTDRDGNLWIRLTVLGVTRLGVGDGKNAKERIGDALRNAAMRFGVALDLWAKGDREWAQAEKSGTDQHPDAGSGGTQQQAPAPYHGPTTAELLLMIDAHAQRAGVTYEAITAKWRQQHGDLTVDQLDSQPPQAIAQLEASIAAYLLEHPPGQAPAPEATVAGAPA